MKEGDFVRVTGGELEGRTGHIIGTFEDIRAGADDAETQNTWWVEFGYQNTEAIAESLLAPEQPQ